MRMVSFFLAAARAAWMACSRPSISVILGELLTSEMISARILARGSRSFSSSVTKMVSANSLAILPISGRLVRSRSPMQPKTRITRPSEVSRADLSRRLRASGVWA